MPKFDDAFHTVQALKGHKECYFYSLKALEKQLGPLHRLPIIIRILLESLLRNCDGKRVYEADIIRLAKWAPNKKEKGDVPFIVSRVLLQDFTGVPLVVDLAAMRDAAAKQGFDPSLIEPHVPVDLVIDHSVQVDRARTEDAFIFNMTLERERNQERYAFLKWGQQAFNSFKVVPPAIGICHQVNLEYLASVVTKQQIDSSYLLYPDTLVGTDSHTTMINGLGVLGWGVGGIEASAAMLGQPVSISMPEIVGFYLKGNLRSGVTATDLTLRITEILRKEKVVGKFVEFFGEGTAQLTVADRATIANMAPEYGATTGFFPIDEKTLDYLKMTGRSSEHIHLIKDYLVAQGLFGIPKVNEIDYGKVIELDLDTVTPCVSGPKRPQDRLTLSELKTTFHDLLKKTKTEGGYGKTEEKAPRIFLHSEGSFSLNTPHSMGGTPLVGNPFRIGWSEVEMVTNRPITPPMVNPGYSEVQPCDVFLTHGTVVIAAITSCTNTSNPSVMIAAGLLAKRAIEKGLRVNSTVKTSLAPGSRVVSDYLESSGLQKYLDALGFNLVGYGCTTCIGNSGPLDEKIEETIKEHDIVTASVLSGNRNFEARIHSSVKANFLMSPPLVVAFALAGRVDINLEKEPVGYDRTGSPVFLHELWPTNEEIESVFKKHIHSDLFKKRYSNLLEDNPAWFDIPSPTGARYEWDKQNTYIQHPPYFDDFSLTLPPRKKLKKLRCLALFGDSVTTDHISPAGAFKGTSPAGQYLLSLGVPEKNFNSYGSRRGNDHVMKRGTFANVRIRNKMAEEKEGGFTMLLPDKNLMPIFDACQIYQERKEPLIIFAGKDYGMGSSRDWAAKGTALLGVHAVVARSFERIHRSNLIGMGVLPLEFQENDSHESLGLTGEETFSILGVEDQLSPGQTATLEITRGSKKQEVPLTLRIDTPIEIEYYNHGGIMQYVLRQILKS